MGATEVTNHINPSSSSSGILPH